MCLNTRKWWYPIRKFWEPVTRKSGFAWRAGCTRCGWIRRGWYVDITGGTKVMSAALALAAVEYCNDFTYIGGDARDPDTGRVLDGSEEVGSRRRTPGTLTRCATWSGPTGCCARGRRIRPERFSGGLRKSAMIPRKRRLNAFAALAEALARSDRFDFGGAVGIFNPRRNDLELSLNAPLFRKLTGLCGHWEAVRDEVKEDKKTPGRATLLELFANADRRAGQGRYDDAVGRLYRAAELRAQQLVRDAFGGELGQVSRDAFPSDKGAAVRAAFDEPDGKGRYQLALRRLFQALEFSDDAKIRQQAAGYDALGKQLQIRNNSLLAHGVKPVARGGYEALRRASLAVCAVAEADIPRWPELTLTLPE